jgi:hypothetical protein
MMKKKLLSLMTSRELLKRKIQLWSFVYKIFNSQILALLRERLPCSENFWRYRRNYEKLLDAEAEKDLSSPKPEKKNVNLASPKIMSKFSPTAGYINKSPGGT